MLQRGSTGFELIGPTGGCFVAQTCWWDQTCDCRLTPDSVTRGQHGRPDPLLQGSNQRGQKGKSHVPPVMLWVTCRVRLHLRPPARPSSRPSLDKVGGCCWGPQLLTDPPPIALLQTDTKKNLRFSFSHYTSVPAPYRAFVQINDRLFSLLVIKENHNQYL